MTPDLQSTVSDSPLEPVLLAWSAGHAAAMLAVTVAAMAGAPATILSLCALVSFSGLIYCGRARWSPGGRFGSANIVSTLRWAGTLILPALEPRQVALWGLLLFALDGVDGWIARRSGSSGIFGEFIDKEADAFLVLMLCVLLHRLPGAFGAWVLLPGVLRYLFVLYVRVAVPPVPREGRGAAGRWIAVLMIVALLVTLAAYPRYLEHCRALVALATLALVGSFAASVSRLYRVSRREENA